MSRVCPSVTDRTWNHYSLPPRVDFCRVEEVDPALIGDSHQLLRHLTWTRRRSRASVYKYQRSCASKGSGGYSPKKPKLNKCVFCRDAHQGKRVSCRSAQLVYLMDCFDPLPLLGACVENARSIMINGFFNSLRVWVCASVRQKGDAPQPPIPTPESEN